MNKHRIIFFGLSDIITPAAQWLGQEHIPFLIFTDKTQADKSKVPVSKEHLRIISSLAALSDEKWESSDIGISVGAPWFFTKKFIDHFPPGRLFNLHGSQLPLYRGGNLFSWYVMNKVHTGLCLIHHMAPEFDAGKVVLYEEFLYPGSCRRPLDYMHTYEQHNGIFLKGFLERYFQGLQPLEGHAQPEYLSAYWPRLKSDINGWINWQWRGEELERFISAFDEPYPGAQTTWRSKKILLKDVYFQPGFQSHPFQYGIISRSNRRWLTVAVNGGELIVCKVLDTSGTSMIDLVQPGDRFITTHDLLDSAGRRVIKGNNGLSVQTDLD